MAPTGFSTRNVCSQLFPVFHTRKPPNPRWPTLPRVPLSILSLTRGEGGIVENGRPYATWKYQNQKVVVEISEPVAMVSSLTNWSCTSSPKFRNRDFITGYPRRTSALRIISESPKTEATSGFGLDRRNTIHVKVAIIWLRPQAGREKELVPPLVVFLKDESHLLLPLRHPCLLPLFSQNPF